MVNQQDLLTWGHNNLKVPYFKLAAEITAADTGKINTEKLKLLFTPFIIEGKIAAGMANHFYPPLMDVPVINAVMLVTESTKKVIVRILTEEYNTGTFLEGSTDIAPRMVVQDYKPQKMGNIEKLLQKQNYQGILDWMAKETGTNWNCLKIGSMRMLEEMRIIEETSSKTRDFLDFLFQTLDSLQKLYATGDFYVYPENKFPLFYFWQNYFGNWTQKIDYQSLKFFISRLLKNQKLNIAITTQENPIFNLLIQINDGRLFIDPIPPQKFPKIESNGIHIVYRHWDSVKAVEMLKTIMKSQSLKELFLNFIPYIMNFAIPRQSVKKKANGVEKKKKNDFSNLISKEIIENIMLDFMGNLNDKDKIWTLILDDGLDNGTPLLGFESEIRDHFPNYLTGLNKTELKIALEKELPFKMVKLKILLNQNYIIQFRSEISGIELPEQLRKIESLLLKGIEIVPEPLFIKNLKTKGLLSTLYHSTSKRPKKRIN